MKPSELITVAKSWLGTPYLDQARLKGVGADCIGFIVGILTDLGIDTRDVPRNYGRQPTPDILLGYLRASPHIRCDPTNTLKDGRIALFFMYKEPQHFGLLNGELVIHCCETNGVVETPLGRWAERIHSVWVPDFLDEAENGS